MIDLTIEQFRQLEFSVREKPILAPFGGAFVVADPSLLTPDQSPDRQWHMFFHTIFGVYHFKSSDGIDFHKVQKITSNAMRPNINKIGDTFYLFYEKTRSLIANGLNLINLAKWKSTIYVQKSTDLVNWSKPYEVVGEAGGFEKSSRGSSISNPFLLDVDGEYRLYFSCGLTFIDDCGFCEPTYIHYASSKSVDSGYIVADKPIIAPDKNVSYLNLCSGCLKVYRLKDGYIGIQNGIYEEDGKSHSTIISLISQDGLNFDFDKVLVSPNADNESSWMHQFVYASHLVCYDNALRLYFNARDTSNMIKGRECIGFAEAKLSN